MCIRDRHLCALRLWRGRHPRPRDGLRRPEPVSYTHLDVYKRQVSTRDGAPEIELVSGEAAILATRSQPCAILAGAARIALASGDIELRRLDRGEVRLRCNAGQVELQHPGGKLALRAGQQVDVYKRQRYACPARPPRARGAGSGTGPGRRA